MLHAATIVPKPAGLDFVTAAAIPLAGAAASQAVDVVDPQPGQVVLINGASGGVGSFAIQLVDARGATVLATGTAEDADRLLNLGAAHVVDYSAGPVADQVRTLYPDGVDALINLAGRVPADLPIGAVRPGGTIASTTTQPEPTDLESAGITSTGIMATPTSLIIAALVEQATAGTLKVIIADVLPIEQAAADRHHRQRQRARQTRHQGRRLTWPQKPRLGVRRPPCTRLGPIPRVPIEPAATSAALLPSALSVTPRRAASLDRVSHRP